MQKCLVSHSTSFLVDFKVNFPRSFWPTPPKIKDTNEAQMSWEKLFGEVEKQGTPKFILSFRCIFLSVWGVILSISCILGRLYHYLPFFCHFFVIFCHYLPLFATVCRYLPLFATICHYLPLFFTFCHYLPLFATIYHILPLFAIFCQHLRLFTTVCHNLPLSWELKGKLHRKLSTKLNH